MDEQSAYELTNALIQLSSKIDTQNARQDETNDLIRALISAMNSNSQELLELREQLSKSQP